MAVNRCRRPRDAPPPLDTVLDLLSNRTRRYALYCLYEAGGPLPLTEVAEQVTVWDPSSPRPKGPAERLPAYRDLYHVHVPKLAAADVVTFERRDDTVELTRNATPLQPFLELTTEKDFEGTDVSLE